jgi:hypothetical protein
VAVNKSEVYIWREGGREKRRKERRKGERKRIF